MGFSIIIPCHNEESVISDKIKNTLLLGEGVQEIIIVDDYSTDNTFRLAKLLAKKNKKIKVLSNTLKNGKNFAMKYALQHASGDIVCMTDADIILPENTISHVLQRLKNGTVGMVSLSTQLVFTARSKEVDAYSFIYERVVRYIKIVESIVDSVPTPHGQALFFKRDLNLVPQRQADDVDLAIQTRKKGFKVKYLRNCFFQEKVVEDANKLRSQKVRRCKAVIDSLLYHTDVLFNPRYALFGFICYPLDLIVYVFSPFIIFCIILVLALILFVFSYWYILMLFLITLFSLVSFTKLKHILNLCSVNFRAIFEYLNHGKSNAWLTPRESKQ